MVVNLVTNKRFRGRSIDENLYSSLDSEYIPLYAQMVFLQNLNYGGEEMEESSFGSYGSELNYRELLYPSPKLGYNTGNRLNAVYANLVSFTSPVQFTWVVKGETNRLHIGGGYILDEEGNILLMTCVRSGSIAEYTEIHLYELQNIFDRTAYIQDSTQILVKENLKLFISPRWFSDSTLNKVWKNLNETYIQEFYKAGVEVVILNSDEIKNKVFKKIEFNFNSIEELQANLRMTSNLLSFSNTRSLYNSVQISEELSQGVYSQLAEAVDSGNGIIASSTSTTLVDYFDYIELVDRVEEEATSEEAEENSQNNNLLPF